MNELILIDIVEIRKKVRNLLLLDFDCILGAFSGAVGTGSLSSEISCLASFGASIVSAI